MKFDWDPAKNRANIAKRGVSFEDAVRTFDGPVLTYPDDRIDYSEQRWVSIGVVGAVKYLTIVHTDRVTGLRESFRRDALRSAKGSGTLTMSRIRKGVSEPAPKPYEADDEGIDFSDIPELDKEWFAKAILRTPPAKEPISIRLDQHVLDYFRKQGKGYQTQINSVLRAYVDQARRRQTASKASPAKATKGVPKRKT